MKVSGKVCGQSLVWKIDTGAKILSLQQGHTTVSNIDSNRN